MENSIKNIIDSSDLIYIASHLNPDGDNLGSLAAMYLALKNYGKNVYMIENDEIPVAQRFLPGLNEAVKSSELKGKPDLFITLDCADLERIGEDAMKLFLSAEKTINIDHHKTNTNFADINIVDFNAPATGEILYKVLKDSDIELNREIATCIYEAISSDTGSFKYDSVRKSTFIAASELLDYDIDINEIAINLYQNRSIEKTNLLIHAMNSLEFYADNKIAFVTLSDDDIRNFNASKSDADGIVEFIRDISTVEIAIFLKDKKDSVKLSLRSKTKVDATKIASYFGGGGHIRAAGATINLPFTEAKKKVIELAEMELNI